MTERKRGKLHTKSGRRQLAAWCAVIVVALLITGIPVGAWFFHQRKVVAIAEIDAPTVIYINAGNKEDYQYLNLTNLDITQENTYQDFVFCVRGKDVSFYKLQLAFTTNNQFEYSIYPAHEVANEGSVPGDAKGAVMWLTHPKADAEGNIPAQTRLYYYAGSGDAALAGTYKNKRADILANTDDAYHTMTYGDYTQVNQYAEPLYWQTDSTQEAGSPDESGEFCDYYLLRVSWAAAKAQAASEGRILGNSRETDLLYITAKVYSSR